MNLHRRTCAAMALTVGLGHASAAFTATTATAAASNHSGNYGFCFEHRQSPATSYVSATFEMPQEGSAPITATFREFAKDAAQRYGVAVVPYDGGNACTYQADAAKVEAYRKQIVAEYAKHGVVVETGWRLVGTPQTLPQDLPRGGGH
jgi:hypothetical protein